MAAALSVTTSHTAGMQRPLPHRRQIVVDAQTGQELDAHITDVRAAGQYVSPKTTAHLAAADGDPFASNLMGRANDGAPPTRTIRRTPGTGRMPSMQGQVTVMRSGEGGR